MTMTTCISGESACGGTSYLAVAPAVPRSTVVGTGITTNTTSATYTLPAGAKTPVAVITGAAAITQTFTFFGSADSTAANGKLLCTITLNGTTKDVDTCDSGIQVTQDWPFYYHTTANTTGGASGTLTIHNGLSSAIGTIDPCSAAARTFIPVDIVTATTTEITPSLAGAGNHYYVCSIFLHTNAANNVALVDDDSDGCGSPTSGVLGGVTAAEGQNLIAGSSFAYGTGSSAVAKTNGTNRVLCLVTSAATQLSGGISVVAAP